MLVVSDISNVFVPLAPESLLVPYSQAQTVIDALLDKLPVLFRESRVPHAALGPAVQAASLALESVGGGRAVVVWSGTESGASVTKRREELRLVGTDKEKTLYQPRNPTLKTLATECATQGSAIDLFVCTATAGHPLDITSLLVLPNSTGGGLYYYPGFQSERDALRLSNEIRRVVSRPCGYDAIAKMRTSRGLTIADYNGNCRVTSSHDIEFTSVDCDKAVAVNIKYDDKLDEKTDSIVQFAMLYPFIFPSYFFLPSSTWKIYKL